MYVHFNFRLRLMKKFSEKKSPFLTSVSTQVKILLQFWSTERVFVIYQRLFERSKIFSTSIEINYHHPGATKNEKDSLFLVPR